MPVEIITGNIFTSKAQTIVNTVNCVGVMGAGIALECRLRFPDMYKKYVDICNQKKMDIGLLWLYKSDERWILNFPTKKHWKYPSKKEYLERGLEKFLATYKDKKIESIAFPLLGADKGGIDKNESLDIITSCLESAPLDIDIEIYINDSLVKDDLFDTTKQWLLANDLEFLSSVSGIKPQYLKLVVDAVMDGNFTQLNQLARVQGIGINTLEKVFRASVQANDQNCLF